MSDNASDDTGTPKTNNATRGLLRQKLAATSPGLRRDVLVTEIRAMVATLLELDDPEEVAIDTGFSDLGLTSLNAVGLRDRLQVSLDATVPITAVMDYPTVESVAKFILSDLLRELTTRAPQPAAPAAPGAPAKKPEPKKAEPASNLSVEELEALLSAELDETD